ATPAGDRRVMGDRKHALGRIPEPACGAVTSTTDIFDAAAEHDRIFRFKPLELPGIAEGKPALRLLLLTAVDDLLHEQAVLVPDAVAERGDRERGHAVHVAGRETAEAAVAERGIGLELPQ